ncbi:MAG: YggS family pyridoxal phosphate-dependent enzyme [Magnetovibrionaceae bacterium]
MVQTVAQNLEAIQGSIAAVEKNAGRKAGSTRLVTVSKTFPASVIEAALQAGERCFGENRVQEAFDKWPALKQDWPDVELHLIGPLQTNKIKRAIELFDVIQTLDREKLAKGVARHWEDLGRPPRKLFIQVNTGEEPQKAGLLPLEVDDFVSFCRDELQLPLAGLMAIPPVEEEPALHFVLLRDMAKRNGLEGLSMGMSADFETAVLFGATHVRVGSAIFGARTKPA